MKRASNLYQNIYKIDNIKKIYHKVRIKCNNKRSIYNYDLYESINLLDIARKLYQRNYIFNNYNIFIIKEPKYRLIMSENISDKVVNHLISEYILIPSLEHKLIDTNVATRINKGSGYAFKMLNKYLNRLVLEKKDIYVLKIDIKKYFYNINHDILISMLKRDIKDNDAFNIVLKTLNTTNEEYINNVINDKKQKEIKRINNLNISYKEKSKRIEEVEKIPLYKNNKGLGIGNMTSQILAIYYLNDIDHYIKEELKCKYYIRYMDDLIILDSDCNKLKIIFRLVKKKIRMLDLEVNNKSRIINLRRGFTFLGYTYVYKKEIIIRINNQTMRRIKKHLKYLKCNNTEKYIKSLASYKGFLVKASYCSKEYLT